MTTNIPADTLRPGLLVSINTSIRGNVTYFRRDIETGRIIETGEKVAKWETESRVKDPAEHDRASKVRSKARNLVTAVCYNTAFGPMCPEADAPDLEKAVAEANRLCDDFNRSASVSRIRFLVLKGRVAQDDVEAVKAINAQVRDLLSDMKDGIENLDVKSIREAAVKAKQIGGVLSSDAQSRIEGAIKAARVTARKIVAAGETAAVEIDRRTIAALTETRTAFLDLDGADDVAQPAASGRAVDLTPES